MAQERNLSELLIRNRKRIIDRWEQRASKEVKAAGALESLVLRDDLDVFLKQVAKALSRDSKKTQAHLDVESSDRTKTIIRHGASRAGHLGYALHEVIFEFHILRQVLFEALEETAPLGKHERDVILDVVEQAVNDAASTFSETLRDVQEYFSATLTHDLRGPLTASKAAAQLILRRPDRHEQVEKLAFHVIESMDRMDQMTRDILDASQLRAGEKLSLEWSEFDLGSLVRETVDDFRLSDPARFMVRAQEGLVGRWSYEGLRRVLQNLLSNAVKYGRIDTPITVSVEEIGDRVTIRVHNQGNPIPKEQQTALFETFRRLKGTSGKVGWGLGLVLAKGIVEAHGGQIQLTSTRETGTSLIVELPRSVRSLRTAG